MKYTQIAIDGPAGAGKSSIAKEIAKKMKYIYIDTGAMYRAVSFFVLDQSIDSEEGVVEIAENIEISFKIVENTQRIFANGRDLTEEIRSPEVSNLVSDVAKIPRVREEMVKKQQKFAAKNNIIMDGRDIGSVVLPEADFKFFLTASIEERATRRSKEMEAKGYDVDFEALKEEIRVRDHNDENREESPLVKVDDAILVDTTELSFDEVLEKIICIIRGR